MNWPIFRGVLLLLILASPAGAQLPDAPTPQPPPPTFWQVGRWDSPHALRSNRQTLKSPWFIIPQAVMWTAVIVDMKRAHLDPNAPRGRELFVDAAIPAMVGSVMSYGSDRLIWRPLGLGIAAYVTFRHGRGAVTGTYP